MKNKIPKDEKKIYLKFEYVWFFIIMIKGIIWFYKHTCVVEMIGTQKWIISRIPYIDAKWKWGNYWQWRDPKTTIKCHPSWKQDRLEFNFMKIFFLIMFFWQWQQLD